MLFTVEHIFIFSKHVVIEYNITYFFKYFYA